MHRCRDLRLHQGERGLLIAQAVAAARDLDRHIDAVLPIDQQNARGQAETDDRREKLGEHP